MKMRSRSNIDRNRLREKIMGLGETSLRKCYYPELRQKQAEEALRESEDKFRVLAEMSSAVIYVYQGENLVYINKAAERITGYSRDELLKMKFWEIMHPDFRELVRERGLARQLGEPVPSPYEVKLVTKGGETRWAELAAGHIMYMGKPAGVATFFDITERKQAEEALKLTQYSIDRAADEIFWITPHGKFIYVNDAACTALQYPRDELQGMSVWDIDPTFTKEKWEDHWQEVKKRGKFTLETINRAKGGRTFPIEVSVNYVKFGEREFNFAYVKDITERKKAENELKEAKAQAELYLDLMGHDINNMNQVALGYLELAEEVIRSGGGVDKHNSELIEKPVISLNNSSKLIDNVRKLQKIKTAQKKIEICPRDILEEAYRQFSGMPGVDIKIYTPEACKAKVLADELLIDVFTNIIGNAIKHSGRSHNPQIVVRSMPVLENEERYCKITIEDNGPGISDDKKGLIFKRFLRGDTKAKGSGLGLYIVNSLIESYGGRVWVEDRIHGDYTKGSRFVVMLPSVDA